MDNSSRPVQAPLGGGQPMPGPRLAVKRSARNGSAGVLAPSPPRVAVIDRDSGFLLVLAKRLERLEWQHRVIAGSVSPKRLVAMELDAVIVDMEVLGPRSWDWLEQLCRARRELAIVVCTGSSTVAQRVRALRLGVDDWLSKPCHPEELVARVEAIVGRSSRPQPRDVEPILVGELEVRVDQYQAFVGGASLELTRREYQLLELFAGDVGSTFERKLIYESLWGYEMVRNDRSVDVFVHKLRRKLSTASPLWRYIHTHPGTGYRFAPEPTSESRLLPGKIKLPVAEEQERELLAA
jgi:DNA-binding response OmpR family regulator